MVAGVWVVVKVVKGDRVVEGTVGTVVSVVGVVGVVDIVIVVAGVVCVVKVDWDVIELVVGVDVEIVVDSSVEAELVVELGKVVVVVPPQYFILIQLTSPHLKVLPTTGGTF